MGRLTRPSDRVVALVPLPPVVVGRLTRLEVDWVGSASFDVVGRLTRPLVDWVARVDLMGAFPFFDLVVFPAFAGPLSYNND